MFFYLQGKVQELSRDNFAVRQHLKYVEYYSNPENYQNIRYEDTLTVQEEVAPLIMPDQEEASAVRFDALLYGIELAYLMGNKYGKARKDLLKKVRAVAGVAIDPGYAGCGQIAAYNIKGEARTAGNKQC